MPIDLFDLSIDNYKNKGQNLAQAIDRAYIRAFDEALKRDLRKLRSILFSSNSLISYLKWWHPNWTQWIKKLRQVMIERRNIGHDWKFTNKQKQQLQRYYDSNKFLADLMKIEGSLTDDVRAEIENTLLLPWEELQNRRLEHDEKIFDSPS
jgi:hypothetical protein